MAGVFSRKRGLQPGANAHEGGISAKDYRPFKGHAPVAIPPLRRVASRAHKADLDLCNGAITWGTYNKRLVQIFRAYLDAAVWLGS